MRINHNMMAMNAHRQLGVNAGSQGKSIEKLSSGLRINRAGDDAAGLAISEKMRSQVRGLGKASRNAQDDISLIQTAEGALNETHDIIHRMREMAVQSANDSNTDADREALQAEMDQLAQEVTRIANDTEFNTRKLINGNLDNGANNSTGDITFHIGANTNQNMKFSVTAMDAKSLDLTEDRFVAAGAAFIDTNDNKKYAHISTAEVSRVEQGNASKTVAAQKTKELRTVTITSTAVTDTGKSAVTSTIEASNTNGTVATIGLSMGDTKGELYNDINVKFAKNGGEDTKVTWSKDDKVLTVKLGTKAENRTAAKVGEAIAKLKKQGDYDFTNVTGEGFGKIDPDNLTGKELKFRGGEDENYTVTATSAASVILDNGTEATDKLTDSVVVKASDKNITFGGDFKGLSFKTDNAKEANQGTVVLDKIDSHEATFNADHSVEKSATAEYGINILSQKSANVAIKRIDSALKKVSDVRAGLGAVQNRLEHTIKNVDTGAENLQAAESRIRDVDMAKEMMNYTKSNILQQASQAMLAQANQAPQGVLQLLR